MPPKGHFSREWTPAELRRMRSVVESGDTNIEHIARQFRTSEREVRRLTAEKGWTNPNAKKVQPKKPTGVSYWSRAKFEAAKREEVANAERRLYGALLDDVQWLRRRGYGVNKERGGYRVGNKVMDADGLRAVANRERRLAGVLAV